MTLHSNKPDWLRVKVPLGEEYASVKTLFDRQGIHTICCEGACPNRNECWKEKTASFLILGNVCTRHCLFCNVSKQSVVPEVDKEEAVRLAETVSLLGLKYAVVTSVTRDDLPDGGAGHFVRCIKAVRERNPLTKIEVLTPDFAGSREALQKIAESKPDVFGHNIETVSRLFPVVRRQADYRRSLDVLSDFKRMAPGIPVKSAMMLGLGEEKKEVESVMDDLLSAGVDFLMLGQYLQPSALHFPVVRFVPPHEFNTYKKTAENKGFKAVFSSPFARSSYKASSLLSSQSHPSAFGHKAQ